MPFSDDVDLSMLKRYSSNLLLVEVISTSNRFRFSHLGGKIIVKFGADVTGKFADEVERREPFNYFIAQASTGIEAAAPTLYSSKSPSAQKTHRSSGYLRIILPAWGNGHINLLLGAIV
jgi:hypothetical protein